MPDLPKDDNGQPIPVLAPGTVANAAVGASSATLAIPSGSKVVEVGASTDSWLVWGTSGSTSSNSTGMFFPKGVAVYSIPGGVTHIAHIQDSTAGRISITRLD
jgi:hypothetical protein